MVQIYVYTPWEAMPYTKAANPIMAGRITEMPKAKITSTSKLIMNDRFAKFDIKKTRRKKKTEGDEN